MSENMSNPTTIPEPLLLTTTEVARLTHLCEKTIRLLIRDGELPGIRIGRALRVATKDVRAWIERKKGGEINGSPEP